MSPLLRAAASALALVRSSGSALAQDVSIYSKLGGLPQLVDPLRGQASVFMEKVSFDADPTN